MVSALDHDPSILANTASAPPGSLRAVFNEARLAEMQVLMGSVSIDDVHGVDSPWLNERRSQEEIKKDRDKWLDQLRMQALIAEIEEDFERIDALFAAIEERHARIFELRERFDDLKQHMILHPDGKIDWVASGKNYELLGHDFQGDEKAAARAMAQKVLDRDGNLRPEYQGNVPAEMIHILRQERDLRHENTQDHEHIHKFTKDVEEKIEQLPDCEAKNAVTERLKEIQEKQIYLKTLDTTNSIEDLFENSAVDNSAKPLHADSKLGNVPSPRI